MEGHREQVEKMLQQLSSPPLDYLIGEDAAQRLATQRLVEAFFGGVARTPAVTYKDTAEPLPVLIAALLASQIHGEQPDGWTVPAVVEPARWSLQRMHEALSHDADGATRPAAALTTDQRLLSKWVQIVDVVLRTGGHAGLLPPIKNLQLPTQRAAPAGVGPKRATAERASGFGRRERHNGMEGPMRSAEAEAGRGVVRAREDGGGTEPRQTKHARVAQGDAADAPSRCDSPQTACASPSLDYSSPLSTAVWGGDEAQVRQLLEDGEDVNAIYDSVLHMAVEQDNESMAQLLLDADADPNLRGEDGHTPLMCAATKGNESIVRLLLGAKAEVNARQHVGMTALHLAARIQDGRGREVTRALLTAGADQEMQDGGGRTAMVIARATETFALPQSLAETLAHAAGKVHGTVRMLEKWAEKKTPAADDACVEEDEAAPAPSADNMARREAFLAARERRGQGGGGAPSPAGHGTAAPSGSSSSGVVTLADLPSSSEEDLCEICGGSGVDANPLVRCGFGDGKCIEASGEAPRHACWHAACEKELHKAPRPKNIVCARHEAAARFKLHVNLTREKQKEYVVLPIASYNDGEFDTSIPKDTSSLTATTEPPPTEAEQLEDREAAALHTRMAEQGTKAARDQRAALRSSDGGGEDAESQDMSDDAANEMGLQVEANMEGGGNMTAEEAKAALAATDAKAAADAAERIKETYAAVTEAREAVQETRNDVKNAKKRKRQSGLQAAEEAQAEALEALSRARADAEKAQKRLVSIGFDTELDSVQKAAMAGRAPRMRALLSTSTAEDRHEALRRICASDKASKQCVELLLQSGADRGRRTEGDAPSVLWLAVVQGTSSVVQTLLEKATPAQRAAEALTLRRDDTWALDARGQASGLAEDARAWLEQARLVSDVPTDAVPGSRVTLQPVDGGGSEARTLVRGSGGGWHATGGGESGGEARDMAVEVLGAFPLAVTLNTTCEWRKMCDTCGQAKHGEQCKGAFVSYQYATAEQQPEQPSTAAEGGAALEPGTSGAGDDPDAAHQRLMEALGGVDPFEPGSDSGGPNSLWRCLCGWSGMCASAEAAAKAHRVAKDKVPAEAREAARAAKGAVEEAEKARTEAASAKDKWEELKKAPRGGDHAQRVGEALRESKGADGRANAAAQKAAKEAENAASKAAAADKAAAERCPFDPLKADQATYYACSSCGWSGSTAERHAERRKDCTDPAVSGLSFPKQMTFVSCVACGPRGEPWRAAGWQALVEHASRGCVCVPVATELPSLLEPVLARHRAGEGARNGVILERDADSLPTRERVWLTRALDDGSGQALRHDGARIPLTAAERGGKGVGEAVEIELRAEPGRVPSKQHMPAWEAKRREREVGDVVEELICTLEQSSPPAETARRLPLAINCGLPAHVVEWIDGPFGPSVMKELVTRLCRSLCSGDDERFGLLHERATSLLNGRKDGRAGKAALFARVPSVCLQNIDRRALAWMTIVRVVASTPQLWLLTEKGMREGMRDLPVQVSWVRDALDRTLTMPSDPNKAAIVDRALAQLAVAKKSLWAPGEPTTSDEPPADAESSAPSTVVPVVAAAESAVVDPANEQPPASTAVVPAAVAARAQLVQAASAARAAAEEGQKGKAAKRAGSTAVCGALRDTLREVDSPGELLEAVGCSKAIGTARHTFHELVTGEAPSGSRAVLRADAGAPWPSDQAEPPDGYALYATGLDGTDPEQVALAKFLQRYAAQAISRRLHARIPPLVLLKPSNGDKMHRLCLLMYATAPCLLCASLEVRYLSACHPRAQERRRLDGHPGCGDGRRRRGPRGGGGRADAWRRRVGRGHGPLQGHDQAAAAGRHGEAGGARAPAARSEQGRVRRGRAGHLPSGCEAARAAPALASRRRDDRRRARRARRAPTQAPAHGGGRGAAALRLARSACRCHAVLHPRRQRRWRRCCGRGGGGQARGPRRRRGRQRRRQEGAHDGGARADAGVRVGRADQP